MQIYDRGTATFKCRQSLCQYLYGGLLQADQEEEAEEQQTLSTPSKEIWQEACMRCDSNAVSSVKENKCYMRAFKLTPGSDT